MIKSNRIFIPTLLIIIIICLSSCKKNDSNKETISLIKESYSIINIQNDLLVSNLNRPMAIEFKSEMISVQSKIDSAILLIDEEKANSNDIKNLIEQLKINYNIESDKNNLIINYDNPTSVESIKLYLKIIESKILQSIYRLYYEQIYSFEYIKPVIVVNKDIQTNDQYVAEIYLTAANDKASMYAVIDNDTIFMDENKKFKYILNENEGTGKYFKKGKFYLLHESKFLEEEGMDFSIEYIVE